MVGSSECSIAEIYQLRGLGGEQVDIPLKHEIKVKMMKEMSPEEGMVETVPKEESMISLATTPDKS